MRRLLSTSIVSLVGVLAAAQPQDIVWRRVAQARSNAAGASPTVQALMAAPGPVSAHVKVDRIVIAPAVITGTIGKPVCISQLDIAAYTDSGQRAHAVPLMVDMQQEHLRKLTFSTRNNDLCLRPTQTGEFTIRFSSQVPAADGTLRGAQVFVRVS